MVNLQVTSMVTRFTGHEHGRETPYLRQCRYYMSMLMSMLIMRQNPF